MSRNFNGSTQWAENGAAVLTTHPITMAAWVYTSVTDAIQDVLNLVNNGTETDWFALQLSSDARVRAQASSSASAHAALSSTTYSANTWLHALVAFETSTIMKAYINGGSVGETNNSVSPSGANRTVAGRRGKLTPSNYFTGRIAELAIWNAVLPSDLIAAVAKGVPHRLICPGNLKFYAPFYGTGSPEPDYSGGGFHMTLNGSPTQADHAPVPPGWGYDLPWQGALALGGSGGLLSHRRNRLVLSA